MSSLIIEHLPVGLLQCNCIILGDPRTGKALVVDPGDEVEKIAAVLERRRLTVAAIAVTHAHIDHVGGLAGLRQLSGAPTMMHEADVPLYAELATQAQFLGVPAPPAATVDRYLADGDRIDFGAAAAMVEHTPGHTPGSVSFIIGSDAPLVLSGDTLFAGGIGRTDLWGGSFDDIIRSIKTRLLALPDDAPVVPGHGPPTTIGFERQTNPFLT